MKVKRPGGRDVAMLAGVSPTTVSLVLNNKADWIPAETQERVRRVARELDYVPNAVARSLVTGRTNRVGFVMSNPHASFFNDTFYNRVLKGAWGPLMAGRRSMVFFSRQMDGIDALFEEIMAGETDGLLILGERLSDSLEQRLARQQIPAVFLCCAPESAESFSVDVDNLWVGNQAAGHLHGLGHRHFLTLVPDVDARQNWVEERIRGFNFELRKSGVDPQTAHRVTKYPTQDWHPKPGVLMEAIFAQRPVPTALFVPHENTAKCVITLLRESGYSVPGDFSVVSCNSTEISMVTRPAQTSVAIPLEEIGKRGATALVDLIEGRTPPKRQLLGCELDVRESTGPARRRINHRPT